mmetsp:Transcript_90857/g.211403  ORF Transcript_90857/g.211403 Transcript_90857/m.211403 type:complete len:507 (-) Transcript_90857:83-1603(-)
MDSESTLDPCEKSLLGCLFYNGQTNATILNWCILFLSIWPWVRYLRWSSAYKGSGTEEAHVKMYHNQRSTLPLVAVLSVGFFTQVFLWDLMAVIKLPVSGISIVWANCLGMLLPVHLNPFWWPDGYLIGHLIMTFLAVLAPVAGIAIYSSHRLTTIAHVCAVVQGVIVGVLIGRNGKCWVRTRHGDDIFGPFTGALSAALHFLFVEKFSIWGIGVSWLGVLDTLMKVLFSRMTGADSLSECIQELSSHMQDPWAGFVNCHFELSYFPGIKVDVQQGARYYEHNGTVWTQWKGVEWAPPLFFCMRYSIPLLCLLLYIHCFAMFFKDGAASYRSGYYIHFTWSLQRSRTYKCLALWIRRNVFLCLVLLLLVGLVWVVELMAEMVEGSSMREVIHKYPLHILLLYWHYMSLTLGSVVFQLVSLIFCTWKLTAPVHMGWDISAMERVVMRERHGWLKLQDNTNIGKHLTEALWQAQRGDTKKLEQMIESPDPNTVLKLCSREETLTTPLL